MEKERKEFLEEVKDSKYIKEEESEENGRFFPDFRNFLR